MFRTAARFAFALFAGVAAAEDTFLVDFDVQLAEGVSKSFTVQVHPDWAPLGAARFRELVDSDFFSGTRFFRVVPGFVAQFGISGDPKVAAEWRGKKIQDDKVLTGNKRGNLVFATSGPNSRTSQLFINFADNRNLDGMGFAAFGTVIEGMEDVVDKIYDGYRERPDQGRIQSKGNEYLVAEFPKLSFIKVPLSID